MPTSKKTNSPPPDEDLDRETSKMMRSLAALCELRSDWPRPLLLDARHRCGRLVQPQAVEEKETELVLPIKRQAPKVAKPNLPLEDITTSSGIDWKHFNAMEGEKLLPETMGGGVSIFDYDNDGDQDILFVGGQSWTWARSVFGNPRSLCLYANDGTGKFTDVSQATGLQVRLQAMGAAVGDYDNDGWIDLLVTGVGGNHLFRNQEGKFTERTEGSGLAGKPQDWTTCAVWVRLRQ